jgi:hypothetical protein
MIFQTIIMCVLAAAFAGFPAYYISFRLNRFKSAAIASGGIGADLGSFLATFLGACIGLGIVSTSRHLPGFPQAAYDSTINVAWFTSFFAALYGQLRGQLGCKA